MRAEWYSAEIGVSPFGLAPKSWETAIYYIDLEEFSMKKIIITLVIILSLIIALIVGFYSGYYYVIKNQYAEKCSDYPNRYHIIVDGNIYEYEFVPEDTNNCNEE